MGHLTALIIWSIAFLGILGMLVRPRGIAEAWWAGGSALLLVVTGLFPLKQAGLAIRGGLDVYLFLAGMMILAEIAREEKVFDWVASIAAQHAEGSPRRLFVLIYVAGAIITALLSNDATAVVLTPAVLAIVRRVKAQPKPYLLACALIANAASFVFPISNPANLVIFGARMPPLLEWLRFFLWPSIVSITVTYFCLCWLSRKELHGDIEGGAHPFELTREGQLALAGLLISAAALIFASALGWPLGATTCVAASFVLVLVTLRDRRVLPNVVRGVSWSMLPLVAGLFVIVEALQNAGAMRLFLTALAHLAGTSEFVGKFAAGFAVAVISNGMNNLPMGLIAGNVLRYSGQNGIVAHALLIGVDLGPNLSVTGSLATILWLVALRREQVEITAWEFLKTGIVVMPLALAASLLVLLR
ncbi:MAG TPA: arsenic transporter [Candidatus Acidoferrales bacterium]